MTCFPVMEITSDLSPEPSLPSKLALCLFSPRRLSGSTARRSGWLHRRLQCRASPLAGAAMRATARGVAAVGHHAAVRSSRFSVLLCEHGPQRPHPPVRDMASPLCRRASCSKRALPSPLSRSAIATISASVSPSPLDCSASDMRPRSAAHPAWDAERSRISSVARFRQEQRGFRAVMPTMGCSKRRLNPTQPQCV